MRYPNWLYQLGKLINKGYRFIWYTVLQFREPFTCILSRMIVAHGAWFWLVYVGVQWKVFIHWYQPDNFHNLVSLAWLLFNAWLVDHLIDYVREHPENTPNPPYKHQMRLIK